MSPFSHVARETSYAALVALLLTACKTAGTQAPVQPASPAAPASSPNPGLAVAPWDSLAPERDSLARQVLATLAGKENVPAESVFKNIQLPALKRRPAAQILGVMSQ